jgi:hypothetical protein
MNKNNKQQAMELLCECLQLPSDSTMEELKEALGKLTTKESEYLKTALESASARAGKQEVNLN